MWFKSKRKKTILIVDDDPSDRRMIEGVLEKSFNVLCAENGADGIAMAREHKPDVIILDYMMPDIKGPEVCHTLKADNDTRFIPIIFLSSETGTEKVMDGYEVGADRYLFKPFSTDDLLSEVQKVSSMI